MKKQQWILFILLSLASGIASAQCNKNEKTVFSCLTGKGKLIEVCDAGKNISYSFGFPHKKPEIVLTVPRNRASTAQWNGIGRYISYAVNIPNGNTNYNVFWSVDKLSDDKSIDAGVNVEVNNKLAATVSCAGEKNIVQNIEGIQLKPVD